MVGFSSIMELEQGFSPLAPALFVIGASMVDVGTTNFVSSFSSAARFPPYGETFFHRPTGRFCDGLVIPDFLALLLGLSSFLSPYLEPGANFSQGADFACAYSGLLDETNINLRVISFRQQLQQFKNHWDRDKLSKSVVVINAGTNDLTTFYISPAKKTSSVDFIHQLVSEYKHGLNALYESGARRIVVIGLAPLGCSPQFRARNANKTGCVHELNELVQLFNAGVESSMQELGRTQLDLDLLYFDAYSMFLDMIFNSSTYGFEETKSSCCGTGPYNCLIFCGRTGPPDLPFKPFLCDDPSKFLYWDIHPTHRANFLMSKAIWSGNSRFMRPKNLESLLSCPRDPSS